MKILAESGIDVLNTNKKGMNALHLAASIDYPEVVKQLLDSGFPDDLETKDGHSAL